MTDELSCLTRGFAHVWRRAGCAWVVREPTGGLRDGFTGRMLGAIADAWTGATVESLTTWRAVTGGPRASTRST